MISGDWPPVLVAIVIAALVCAALICICERCGD